MSTTARKSSPVEVVSTSTVEILASAHYENDPTAALKPVATRRAAGVTAAVKRLVKENGLEAQYAAILAEEFAARGLSKKSKSPEQVVKARLKADPEFAAKVMALALAQVDAEVDA